VLAAFLLLLASAPSIAAAGQSAGTITGRILDVQGAPLSGVAVTLAGGPAPVGGTTDSQGHYSFAGLADAVYTVTPTQAATAFEPLARQVSLFGDTAQLDFTGSAVSFAISGVVVDANGSPLAGVTVTPSSGPGPVTTDATGHYVVTGLTRGASLTLTPSLAGFTFAPASQDVGPMQGDVAAPPFAATGGLFRRFFAEGAVNGFFDTTIALLNPTTGPTVAHLTFQPSGGPAIQRDIPMAALSRATVNPKTLGLTQADFATVVESEQPIVADRTMTWDATGYGSHAETSVDTPRPVWYFAEGSTTGSFNLFYLLQNPGSQAAQVEIRYLRPAPLAPIVKTYSVAAGSRRTIYVNQEDPALDETDVSAVVTSLNAVPIIAERAMYTNALGQAFGAGHDAAGIAAPSAQWFLAEGATGPFFNMFVLVANPTGTAAELEFRYLLTDGRTVTRHHTAAPNSRLTIGVHGEGDGLDSAALSTVVTSTNGVPVLVERAMWWPATGPAWYEAHASAGATATGTKWALADGEVGGPRETQTYVLIANPATFAGSAAVTLVFEGGGTTTKTFALLASSRFNVDVGAQFPEAVGRRFGTIVESVGAMPAPIVVERAMYSNAGGVVWAAGTNVVATRLTGRPAVPVIVAPPAPQGVQPAPVTTAGILGGDPETPAPLAIPDVIAETTSPRSEVSKDADGVQVVRTKLEIAFRWTATVAQVNGVLDALGGRIVNALAGVPIVVVRIPDPGSLAALEALVDIVSAQPAVAYARRVEVPVADSLPETHASTGPLGTIDHLLADRAPAAWNVRTALVDPRAKVPLEIVTDFFGGGPPNSAVNATLVGTDFATGNPTDHGYHVLGTIAGTFANAPGVAADPNAVVGLFPHRLDVRVFDYQTAITVLPDLPEYANTVLRFVRDAPGHVVVNTSVGRVTPYTLAEGVKAGRAWTEKVRHAGPGFGGSSLENRFVQAQTAGNNHVAVPVLGAFNSEPGAATLIQNLTNGFGDPLPNLTNTLIVENRLNTPVAPFEPACRKATSNVGGTIAAIGTDVYSLLDPGTTAGDESGTSMASPQVAALATYLWALAPSLTAAEVIARLKATARPGVPLVDPRCSTVAVASAPSIDAYAAVLSADQGLSAPLVRSTLLDVTNASNGDVPDGRFDEHDVQRFATEIDRRAGTLFDYSRYDLNGDGRTGGDATDRFDLDADAPAPAAWTTVTQTVEGSPVSFDETKLTDIQILCYYAYSPLYVGDEAQRTSLLNGRCTPGLARLLAHTGVLIVGAFALPASHQEQLLRPNPQTDLVTPWEIHQSQAVSSLLGAASYDATVTSDRITGAPSAFTGADLGFEASCTADQNPGDSSFARGSASYGGTLNIQVTAPQVRISWQVDLAPAASGDEPPELLTAQSVLLNQDTEARVFETNTDAALGPIGFSTEQVIPRGRYLITVNGHIECTASTAAPHAATTGHARLTLTLTPVP